MCKVTHCEICGEPLGDDKAEMYEPNDPEYESQIVHPECGLQAGLEIA